MPYIKQERRKALNNYGTMETSGELNFALTKTIDSYLRYKKLSYQTCNDIVGALENCKHEFQRRIQDPYEDQKIKENGDVYS